MPVQIIVENPKVPLRFIDFVINCIPGYTQIDSNMQLARVLSQKNQKGYLIKDEGNTNELIVANPDGAWFYHILLQKLEPLRVNINVLRAENQQVPQQLLDWVNTYLEAYPMMDFLILSAAGPS